MFVELPVSFLCGVRALSLIHARRRGKERERVRLSSLHTLPRTRKGVEGREREKKRGVEEMRGREFDGRAKKGRGRE
jgi:hypothetical protein